MKVKCINVVVTNWLTLNKIYDVIDDGVFYNGLFDRSEGGTGGFYHKHFLIVDEKKELATKILNAAANKITDLYTAHREDLANRGIELRVLGGIHTIDTGPDNSLSHDPTDLLCDDSEPNRD